MPDFVIIKIGQIIQKGELVKIGIVGGGAAGLMAAWLLEQDYDVTLFESSDRLGGHIDTIYVPVGDQLVPVEAGFEFFSEASFPVLCRLLSVLNVEYTTYPLTYTFTGSNKSLIHLPPCVGKRIIWRSLLPRPLCILLQFKYFLIRGSVIVKSKNAAISMQEFADSIALSKRFKNDFLYPFYAGSWGTEINDIKTFSAYDILKWSDDNSPAGLFPGKWLEIVGGASVYIQALSQQLSSQVNLSATITDVTHDGKEYAIAHKGGVVHVDHLVIATNAIDAKKLLANISHAHQHRTALDRFNYFSTNIAVHGDERWMPKSKRYWSVIAVLYDGDKSSLTTYKAWNSTIPVFRSWIMHNEKLLENNLPQPLYALRHYYHAKVTPDYFVGQRELQALQGNNGLWLAGMYMYDIDSHDSALMSAITIARVLAPDSARLTHFE